MTADLIRALERIADPKNTHFAGDAQVVASEALAAYRAQAPAEGYCEGTACRVGRGASEHSAECIAETAVSQGWAPDVQPKESGVEFGSMCSASMDKAVELCERHGHAGDAATLRELRAALSAQAHAQPKGTPTHPGLERLKHVDAEIWTDVDAALKTALEDHSNAELDELDLTLLRDLVALYRQGVVPATVSPSHAPSAQVEALMPKQWSCSAGSSIRCYEEQDVRAAIRAALAQAPAPAPVPPEHLPTKEHIRELAQEALDQVMEQAQVFASAWSLVGGKFDSGNAMSDAEDAKAELRTMVRSLADLAAETVRPAQCAAVTHRESDRQLMDFYSVETLPALIDAQEEHIRRLQAKLPPLNQPAFTRVREG